MGSPTPPTAGAGSPLEELGEEERLISARRRNLHDRMAMYPQQAERLVPREREVSRERRELQRRIYELRAEREALATPSDAD